MCPENTGIGIAPAQRQQHVRPGKLGVQHDRHVVLAGQQGDGDPAAFEHLQRCRQPFLLSVDVADYDDFSGHFRLTLPGYGGGVETDSTAPLGRPDQW